MIPEGEAYGMLKHVSKKWPYYATMSGNTIQKVWFAYTKDLLSRNIK